MTAETLASDRWGAMAAALSGEPEKAVAPSGGRRFRGRVHRATQVDDEPPDADDEREDLAELRELLGDAAAELLIRAFHGRRMALVLASPDLAAVVGADAAQRVADAYRGDADARVPRLATWQRCSAARLRGIGSPGRKLR